MNYFPFKLDKLFYKKDSLKLVWISNECKKWIKFMWIQIKIKFIKVGIKCADFLCFKIGGKSNFC